MARARTPALTTDQWNLLVSACLSGADTGAVGAAIFAQWRADEMDPTDVESEDDHAKRVSALHQAVIDRVAQHPNSDEQSALWRMLATNTLLPSDWDVPMDTWLLNVLGPLLEGKGPVTWTHACALLVSVPSPNPVAPIMATMVNEMFVLPSWYVSTARLGLMDVILTGIAASASATAKVWRDSCDKLFITLLRENAPLTPEDVAGLMSFSHTAHTALNALNALNPTKSQHHNSWDIDVARLALCPTNMPNASLSERCTLVHTLCDRAFPDERGEGHRVMLERTLQDPVTTVGLKKSAPPGGLVVVTQQWLDRAPTVSDVECMIISTRNRRANPDGPKTHELMWRFLPPKTVIHWFEHALLNNNAGLAEELADIAPIRAVVRLVNKHCPNGVPADMPTLNTLVSRAQITKALSPAPARPRTTRPRKM